VSCIYKYSYLNLFSKFSLSLYFYKAEAILAYLYNLTIRNNLISLTILIILVTLAALVVLASLVALLDYLDLSNDETTHPISKTSEIVDVRSSQKKKDPI
jgi:hypothetical protein